MRNETKPADLAVRPAAPTRRPALAERPLVFAQLGGCNLSQIVDFMPNASRGVIVIRAATPSLVSPPLPTSRFRFPTCPLKSKFIVGDFRKEHAEALFRSDWDVLMVDLLRDFFTGAVEVDGTYVTEFNKWIHGEPVPLGNILKSDFEVITWQSLRFREVWSAATLKLYEMYLKPALDQGRRIVMAELHPAFGEYRETELWLNKDGIVREYSFVLGYMYDFFAALDPRIIRLSVEEDYWYSAFDVKDGAYDSHKISDFYARGAEILCEELGIPAERSRKHIAAKRLEATRERYMAHARIHAAQEERIEALTAESERLASERDTLAMDIKVMSATLAQTAARQTEQQHVLDLAERAAAAHARTLTDRDAEITALKTALDVERAGAVRREDLAAAHAERDRFAAIVTAFPAALQSAEAARAEAQIQAAALRLETAQLNAALVAAEQRSGTLETDLAAMRSGADSDRMRLTLVAEATADSLAAERTALAAATAEATRLSDALAAMSGEAAALQGVLAARTARLSQLDEAAIDAEQRYTTLLRQADDRAVALAEHQAATGLKDRQLGELQATLDDLHRRHAALAEERNRLDADRNALEQQFTALKRSTSWRITAPMRAVKTAWLRVTRRG